MRLTSRRITRNEDFQQQLHTAYVHVPVGVHIHIVYMYMYIHDARMHTQVHTYVNVHTCTLSKIALWKPSTTYMSFIQ